MIEMSPCYAYPSQVGPVFDVAAWSPRKVLTMAVVGLLFGAACAVAAAYLWNPGLFAARPPGWLKGFNEELARANKQHPRAMLGLIGFLALMALIFLVGAVSCAADLCRGDYYFRVGPGGLSLRVPGGLSLHMLGLGDNALVLDIPWDEIDDFRIVQHKRVGSLSRDAGNLDAYFQLKTVDGRKHRFSLDVFHEPARIIDSKIRDAVRMVPAEFVREQPPGAQDPVGEHGPRAGQVTSWTTAPGASPGNESAAEWPPSPAAY